MKGNGNRSSSIQTIVVTSGTAVEFFCQILRYQSFSDLNIRLFLSFSVELLHKSFILQLPIYVHVNLTRRTYFRRFQKYKKAPRPIPGFSTTYNDKFWLNLYNREQGKARLMLEYERQHISAVFLIHYQTAAVRAFASQVEGWVFESQPGQTLVVKTGIDSSTAKSSAIGLSVTGPRR